MMTVNVRKNILAATVCALCSMPFTVTASETVGNSSATNEISAKTVSYGDLNMSTVEGLETLHRRLSLAARQVCGTQSITAVGLARATSNRACHDAALERAIAEVHDVADLAVVVAASIQQGS